MKRLFQKIKSILNLRILIGLVLGAIAGYVYYYFIGCSSGTCAITSNPVNSTLYGSLFGVLLFYKKSNDKKNNKEKTE